MTIIFIASGQGVDVGVVEQGLVTISPGEFLKMKVNTNKDRARLVKTNKVSDMYTLVDS